VKYKKRIEDQNFIVDVGDINSRPILVNVDGEAYEVWPETQVPEPKPPESITLTNGVAVKPPSATTRQSPVVANEPEKILSSDQIKALRAPIPGIIIKVTVQAGAEVTYGQELCVLEAMKMNNLIRAPRAGTIAAVHVSEGKHVKHGDLLMEFA
jgi:biotin carboxyl carrier protein